VAAPAPPLGRAGSPLGAITRAGPAAAAAGAMTLLAVAILLAYLPAVVAGLGFVSDDFMILQRLRVAEGLRGAVTFFGQSYYDYYRPIGFVSFAADWTLWGDWPAGYHATSILLHLLNVFLVFLLARRLLNVEAAVVAAALFGLHVVNQEAVFWAAARFDLLATAGALGALLLLGSRLAWRHAAAALVYLAALLSKESVVALPVAAGAYLWVIRRERPAELLRAFAWLGAAGVIYLLLRQASGLAAVGGAGRIPKLAVLAALLLVQLAGAHPATSATRAWLRARRGSLLGCAALAVAVAGVAALTSAHAAALRGAFSAFGFAALHVLSPVSPISWLNPLPGWLASVGVAAAGAMVLAAWRLGGRDAPLFLGFFLAAALLPVSSMTEGSRYLYLASVPMAMAAAWGVAAAGVRTAAAAYTLLAVVLVAFGWQVREKGRDWLWASAMTSRAVQTIVEASGPGCRGSKVFLATAPVRVRGVYSNINAEGLAALGDCRPASVTTVVRLGHHSPEVTAVLAPERLTLTAEPYAGGFVTSADLQRFDILIDRGAPIAVNNPLGRFEAAAAGSALVISQAFARPMDADARWFVFTRGRLEFLPAPAQAAATGPGLP
jgi:hypothetical protein